MFRLSVFRRCCPWRSARRKPFVECCGNLVALQGRTIVTSVSSDARHCSCSSSKQRYSRSHKRDRHSRSNCCPTAKRHGCEGFLPGLISTCKVTNFIRLFDHCLYLFLMNSSKKEKVQQPGLEAHGSAPVEIRREVASREDDHTPTEGQTRANARERARNSVIRARTSETAKRVRIAARPQNDTAA
jgi:hypothetical protein